MSRSPGSLEPYLEERRRRVVDTCTACGTCFRKCPVLEHFDFS